MKSTQKISWKNIGIMTTIAIFMIVIALALWYWIYIWLPQSERKAEEARFEAFEKQYLLHLQEKEKSVQPE